MTLQEFLDFNIDHLHRVVEDVAPGCDPAPTLWFLSGDGRINVVLLPLKDKAAEFAECRKLMRDKAATMYATIMSAWQMNFSHPADDEDAAKQTQRLMALYEEYGSAHPEVLPYRREVCTVTAGDRTGTLIARFDCQRDEAGKIIGLVRQPSHPADQMASGRMFDLLAEARQ